jgi:polar amino acid transport system ATP-binding protein
MSSSLPASDVLVKAIDVTKHFGTFKALDKVSLEISKGEVCCIIGPSGSGKSTFLRCINLLERIDGGSLWIGGEQLGYRREGDRLYEISDQEIARQRRRTGMVFQKFNLFPHRTALENVTEGPIHVLKENRKAAEEHARDLLARVGLADKMSSYPSELSGGQQQRVAIARAMGMRPEIILFDEPTSALDPELVSEVLDVMKDLAQSGLTMVVVTHEMGFARNVANTVAFMEQGRIEETGPAEKVLTNPDSPRCAAFIRAVQQ